MALTMDGAGGSLDFLARRVREETEAAIKARSAGATMIHVVLATAYAKRLGEASSRQKSQTWADLHRLW